MEFVSNTDTILESRAFLMESCQVEVRDIHELKPAAKSDSLQLLDRLSLPDEVVLELTESLLGRGARLDVTDVVGALSDKLNTMHSVQDDLHLSAKRKQEHHQAAMDTISDYFREIDRIEEDKARQERSNLSQSTPGSVAVSADVSVSHITARTGECDFELMHKLTGQWGRWTGNVAVNSEMKKMSDSKGCFPVSSESAEKIKIPFKPSMWLKGGRLKRHVPTEASVGGASLESGAVHEDTANPEAQHPPAGDTPTTPTKSAHGADLGLVQITHHQVAYGATRYEPPSESTYWANLTLTECLMASPCFQHLSSDKFRALEHFAVLRSFADQETILEANHKFYSIFFVRRGAVKVLKAFPAASLADHQEPEAALQILQSGDLFGFECTSPDITISSARFHYQALGSNVECYAIPVEYFVDICLKEPLSAKSAPVKVHMYLECDHNTPDAAQVSLAQYALAQQETLRALSEISRSSSGGFLSVAAKAQYCENLASALMRFDQLVNPELDFAQVIDELLSTTRELMSSERTCLYVIDRKTESMRFFCPPAVAQRQSFSSTPQGAAQNMVVGEGSVSSLSGIIDHVVQHACTLNISNFATSEFFDTSVEKRTMAGKRIKHLLLVPVFDLAGHVIAVMQHSNPKDRDGFSAADVQIAESIASKAALIKMTTHNTVFSPIHALPLDCLTFRLDHLVMTQTNRHLKGTVQLYIGDQPYGPAVATASVATYPIMGDLRRADFKQEISFHNLPLSDLPVTTRIVFAFESTNHHPIVWCGMYLFDYLRRLQKGDRNIVMWDTGVGKDPRDIPAVLEGLPYEGAEVAAPSSPKSKKSTSAVELMQSSNAVLTVCLQDHQATVVHTSPGVVKYYLTMGLHNPTAVNPLPRDFAVTPVPLAAGVRAVDWYLRQLLPTELSIFTALKKIVDVISAADIDSETSRLIWRMRNALCAECPWAMPWFLLCCDWTQKAKVEEAHRLLYSWTTVTPVRALQLLDSRFRDPKVRAFAAGVVGQLNEAGFRSCLYQLVYCLRFETHCDSALARLLLRRALHRPNTIGKQMLWYLHSMFARDPIAYAQAQRLLKIYLRSISDGDRSHQGHGLYALQRIDAIYRGISSSNLFPPHRTPEPEQVVEVLLSELNQNPWPSEFTVPAPVSQELHTTGVVQCKKLPHIPHSFMLTLKYPGHPAGRILYSHAIDVRTEMLYQQMLRSFDLAWQQEDVQLSAMGYESFLIGGTGAIAQNVVAEGKPIAVLAVAAVEHEPATGWGASFSTKAKAIPETLLDDFWNKRSVSDSPAATSASATAGTVWNAPDDATSVKPNFVKALAAFVIVNQVLCLRDVTLFNTVLTPRGELYVQNPTSVLGFDHNSADTKSVKANLIRTDMLLYLRCFESILGDADSTARRDFTNLMSVAFLSLRKHVTFLLWTLGNVAHQIGISTAQSAECAEILKDKLLLSMNDEVALERLRDILQRSVKAEPTMSATEAANVTASMKQH